MPHGIIRAGPARVPICLTCRYRVRSIHTILHAMQVSARAQRLEPVSFVLSDSSQQLSQHQIRRMSSDGESKGSEKVAQSRGAAECVGKGRDPGEEGDDGGGAEAPRLHLLRGRPIMEAGRAIVARDCCGPVIEYAGGSHLTGWSYH